MKSQWDFLLPRCVLLLLLVQRLLLLLLMLVLLVLLCVYVYIHMINYVGGGGNGSLRVGQGMISIDGRPKWLRKDNDHATPTPNPPHPPIHLSTHPLTLGWSEPCDTRKKMCGTWNDYGPRQSGAEERQEAKRVGQGLISIYTIQGRSG